MSQRDLCRWKMIWRRDARKGRVRVSAEEQEMLRKIIARLRKHKQENQRS